MITKIKLNLNRNIFFFDIKTLINALVTQLVEQLICNLQTLIYFHTLHLTSNKH